MVRFLLRPLTLSLVVLHVLSAHAQVSQEAQNRKILLEEYTALNCGNCPAGHVVAEAILAAHPAEAVLVNLHAGPLAVPSGSQPDFRNPWSTQLLGDFGIGATPRGLVNRRAYNGSTVLSTANWTGAANTILALPSVVNMAASTAFDNDARLLTVNVALYYTADSPGDDDRIFVLLTEDHLPGWQSNYGAGGHFPNYDHRYVMRAYLTALTGDPVSTTSMGTSVARTYTYTVPQEFEIANCSVVAFVGESALAGYGEVHQVATAPALSIGAGVDEGVEQSFGRAYPVPAQDQVIIPIRSAPGASELRISDATGRVLKRMALPQGTTSIALDVQDLPAGIYFYGEAGRSLQRLVIAR
jgi:Outer membrane protein Omp28/Secretion system C-terminal sorting domain